MDNGTPRETASFKTPMTESKYEYLGQLRHQTLVGRNSSSPWELAVTHRKMILQLLPGDSAAGRRGMVCVLGAGECHDLNLETLLARHHEVHLVDLESDRLSRGVDAQKMLSSARIRRFGGCDITGVRDLLEQYAVQPDDKLLKRAEQAAGELALAGLAPCEVVLSADLLPELLRHADRSLGAEHPRRTAIFEWLTVRHVELMLDLTVPGGEAILVTGITTSRVVPELAQAPTELAELLQRADARGGISPGCHPAALDYLLKTHPLIAGRLERYDISPLWLRQELGEVRLYVAYRLVPRASSDADEGAAR